jgi:TetR/AcrR family transcriptional regulator, lmrAB and yxaGH operons repressor
MRGIAAWAIVTEFTAAREALLLGDALKGSETVTAGVRRYIDGVARKLLDSGYRDGCPVATIALETKPGSAVLTEACAEAVGSWTTKLTAALTEAGATRARASELAIMVIANIEGALLLSRVAADTEPLRLTTDAVCALLETELRYQLSGRTISGIENPGHRRSCRRGCGGRISTCQRRPKRVQ